MTSVEDRPLDLLDEHQPEEVTKGAGLSILLGLLAFLGITQGFSLLVIVLGVIAMIFFHELGHYVTAKSAGMKVTEFFLGFGPRIWSFRRGETEYGIKAIPAGAYVKIIGMNNLDEVNPADEQRTYRQKPFYRQISVAVAGSAMHFLMATATIFLLLTVVGFEVGDDWTVNGEPAEQTAAFAAGVHEGDQIVRVDGEDVSTFDVFGDVVQARKGQVVDVELVRDGAELVVSTRIGERLTAEGAAPLPGIEEGNRILAVDGEPVSNYDAFVAAVDDGASHVVLIDTSFEVGELELTVAANDLVPAQAATTGFFGVGPTFATETESIPTASYRSFEIVGRMMWEATKALGRVFTPSGLADFVGGAFGSDDDPAVRQSATAGDENRLVSIKGAVDLGTQATEDDGIAGFLGFFFILNIFVGVFNLVPLYPLDGGHVVFATYERIRSLVAGHRYHADAGKLLPLTYVVVSLLIFVGIVALYRDIVDPITS